MLVADCFTYPMPPGIGKSQPTCISELSSLLSTGTPHIWWWLVCTLDVITFSKHQTTSWL
jgi:hypothetical protein